MDARTAILARARDAIARSQRGPARPVPRDYIRVGEHAPGSPPVVADMVDKLEDYDAVVRTESADAGIAEAIDDLLGEARLVVVPTGLPEAYKRAAARSGRELVEDSPEQPIATLDLDRVDAVVTCSRVGISISGTIVLDGEPDKGAGRSPWCRTGTCASWSASRSCRPCRRRWTCSASTPPVP